MQINQLSQIDKVAPGDLLVVFSTQNGDARAAAVSALIALVQQQITSTGGFMTQYAAPNATGFTATIQPVTAGGNVFLLLTPTAAFAAGTVVLPAGVDGQELLVTCTQAVTALTVTGAGPDGTPQAVNGAPTALAANGFFRMRFDGVFKAWYRVG